MRNRVRMVGQVSGMPGSVPRLRSAVESGVDFRSQFAAHTIDLGELVDARRRHAADAAEMLEQCRTPFRADADDFLQPAFFARLFTALAMSGDGEAMRLV